MDKAWRRGRYIEYQIVCPFLGNGSPRPLPRKRVCLPLGPKRRDDWKESIALCILCESWPTYMSVLSICCCTIYRMFYLNLKLSPAKLSHFSDTCWAFVAITYLLEPKGGRGWGSVGLFYYLILSALITLDLPTCFASCFNHCTFYPERGLIRDRRSSTAACPACWAMGPKEMK